MRFVWGLMWIGIGFILIRFVFTIVQTFGKIGWAEAHLGGGLGGTYTLYKSVGVLIIIFGFLYMFNALDLVFKPLAPLFGAK